MTLYVDADACPVKDEALRAAVRHNRRLVLVCNGGIRPVDHPLVEMVYVGDGLDEADRWIIMHRGAFAVACNLGERPVAIPVSGEVVLSSQTPESGTGGTTLPGHSFAVLRRDD